MNKKEEMENWQYWDNEKQEFSSEIKAHNDKSTHQDTQRYERLIKGIQKGIDINTLIDQELKRDLKNTLLK